MADTQRDVTPHVLCEKPSDPSPGPSAEVWPCGGMQHAACPIDHHPCWLHNSCKCWIKNGECLAEDCLEGPLLLSKATSSTLLAMAEDCSVPTIRLATYTKFPTSGDPKTGRETLRCLKLARAAAQAPAPSSECKLEMGKHTPSSVQQRCKWGRSDTSSDEGQVLLRSLLAGSSCSTRTHLGSDLGLKMQLLFYQGENQAGWQLLESFTEPEAASLPFPD